MERYVQGKPITLRLTPRDEDGAVIDLAGVSEPAFDPGTVSIVDGAGLEVDAGAAELAADGSALTFDVDTDAVDLLDSYRATWSATGDVTDFELVGGFLFELGDLRAYNDRLQDTDEFPAEALRRERIATEEDFEDACNVAFVPRGARCTLIADGSRTLILPHLEVREVYGITVDGTALDATTVAAVVVEKCGILKLPDTVRWTCLAGTRISVHYEHGYPVTPMPVARAALTLAGENLLPSSIPKRATVQTSGEQSFRITIAGRDGETGIPEVDAVIKRQRRERVAVG